jgi:hypothetical protein
MVTVIARSGRSLVNLMAFVLDSSVHAMLVNEDEMNEQQVDKDL